MPPTGRAADTGTSRAATASRNDSFNSGKPPQSQASTAVTAPTATSSPRPARTLPPCIGSRGGGRFFLRLGSGACASMQRVSVRGMATAGEDGVLARAAALLDAFDDEHRELTFGRAGRAVRLAALDGAPDGRANGGVGLAGQARRALPDRQPAVRAAVSA